jgi:glycosyltransferase involved in cell wall biosynthesis
MKKITYILFQYPQLSESYASTEMRYLSKDYKLDVITRRKPDSPGEAEQPYEQIFEEAEILERTRKFSPDIIHTHWLGADLGLVCRLSKELDVPFTVRAHSFDVLWHKQRWYKKLLLRKDSSRIIRNNLKYLQSELCLGVLTFPFAVGRLIGAGIPEKKVVPCWPVVDYQRFHDESDNVPGRVMNGGASLPKKDFDAYLDLGQMIPNMEFNLYPIGYQADRLVEKNQNMGHPVNIHKAVPNKQMLEIYKNHEWLVYTADWRIGTVGWPVVVAEAQAAGVGVCMPNLRPDLKEYIGPAGFLYDSLEEVAEIIQQPYPEEMRKAGFEHARKSDVSSHIHLLTDLWEA